MKCVCCNSDGVQKYQKIADSTQILKFYCYCPICGFEGDMLHINDLIYEWNKLPQRRVFTYIKDYRDTGGGIWEETVDFDAPIGDDRVKLKRVDCNEEP